MQTKATADGDGFVLYGLKWHVPYAKAATALVVLARTGEGDDDIDLFLVDAATAGVTVEQQLTLALRKAAAAKGRGDLLALWAGQNASSARALPAAEIVAELVRETEAVFCSERFRAR